MIQIGTQPPAAAFREGRRSDPADAIGNSGSQSRLVADPSEEASDGILFVSPPPLPFPRVFPGL
ncbi:MAG: hypothetical protein K2X72_36640 [Reyranella sp.]|nr:hypothetical protein [Reyranella sp.]